MFSKFYKIEMKDKFTFGIITPSYAPDYERCKLLNHSIKKFSTDPVNHHIIIDQRDYNLFYQLKSETTHIITKESILPWWIKRVPFSKKLWFSFKTLPLRGWLVQQIIKIASSLYINEDVSVFIDSDVVFVRPFKLEDLLISNGKVRLFRDVEGNDMQKQWHLKWHKSASQILGLSNVNMIIPDYIDQIVSWRKDRVIQLCQHIESVSGLSWIETLCNFWNLSEYVLYGIFIERILQEKSGHNFENNHICHNYWFNKALPPKELESFINAIEPDQVAIMISAKSNMTVESYRSLLEERFFK